ncbi:hypothetical protein ACO0LF_01305 [Undibacterium sp. Di27W]|uniref:hypothetical protein n=1 Tax=Undibacterium sp. Di27W TaxID=3413036 RepID=UPI003BEFFA02
MQMSQIGVKFFDVCEFLPRIIFFSVLLSLSGCSNAVEFVQIFTGANGPTAPNLYHFENKEQLDLSWVKSAMSHSDYEKILSRVDFKRQVLVAVSIGERDSVSKNVQISEINLLPVAEDTIVDVSVRVGMVSKKCEKNLTSYVFVLGTFEKPKKVLNYGGFELDNFDAGCITELSGQSKVGNRPGI